MAGSKGEAQLGVAHSSENVRRSSHLNRAKAKKKQIDCLLPEKRGYEEGGHKTPQRIVDRPGQVASVRQREGDDGQTAHAHHDHDGVEDKLRRILCSS